MADARYTVRYTSSHTSSNPRFRYVNSTVLNCMLDDLKPNTQYEFAVKVIKVSPADNNVHLVVFASSSRKL